MNAYHKGANGERELAAILSELLHVEAKRGARPYLFGSMGPDVYGVPGIHVEAKRREAFSIPAALRQSASDATHDEVAIVAHRPNRCGWIVSLWIDDLVKLASAITALQEPSR